MIQCISDRRVVQEEPNHRRHLGGMYLIMSADRLQGYKNRRGRSRKWAICVVENRRKRRRCKTDSLVVLYFIAAAACASPFPHHLRMSANDRTDDDESIALLSQAKHICSGDGKKRTIGISAGKWEQFAALSYCSSLKEYRMPDTALILGLGTCYID